MVPVRPRTTWAASRSAMQRVGAQIPWIALLVLVMAGVEALLANTRRTYSDLVWRQVETIYADQLRSENPHLVAQALNTAEAAGVIACTEAVWRRPDGRDEVYFDSTFRPECASVASESRGRRELVAANGQRWTVKTTPGTYETIAAMAWPTRVATLAGCLLAWLFHRGRMRRQREVSALRLSHLEGMRRIAAQVAHDIRSPAAALRQLVTELPEAKRRVALMAVERISEVSRDVLGYERASRREPDAPTEHVAAGPLTTVDVLGAVRQIAEERNAGAAGGGPGRIQLSGAAVGDGLHATADPIQLRRVVANVLSNALEAGGSQPVDVGLCRKGALVEIAVGDRGAGMPESVRAELLAGRRVTTKRDGHGLGLTHAISVVRGWGGSVRFDAREGGGTLVTISIPAAAADDDATPTPGEQAWDAMLVENDVWIREAWSEAARGSGHRLLVVSEPSEALEAARTLAKSVPIFVDLDLERGQRGEDLVDELARRGFQNVFLATGHEPGEIDKGVRERARGVLGKDYPQTLIAGATGG